MRRLREDYDKAMSELGAMSRERDNWRTQHEDLIFELERERKVLHFCILKPVVPLESYLGRSFACARRHWSSPLQLRERLG